MLYEDAEPLTSVWTVLIVLVLITCTLPRKKKTSSLAIHTKLSMCRLATGSVCLIRRRGGVEKTGSNCLFTQ
ncbi:unnamed protein product [Staurois parvus]|uniref:ATP synthase F0 subunit 8 n=1 Tax=Staurois parvus TaxID=386267 RepID=A0ABN9ACE1_9NEOB|nr:unnamed protein product [Staurois parvus]